VFAIRHVNAASKDGNPRGYDLDGHCTGAPTSLTKDASCIAPNGGLAVDGEGGDDNVFGTLLAGLSQGFSGSASGDFAGAAVTNRIQGGTFTEIIIISDYNGEPSDPSVQVSMITAGNLSPTPSCDAGAAPRAQPQWDGCDLWPVVSGSND